MPATRTRRPDSGAGSRRPRGIHRHSQPEKDGFARFLLGVAGLCLVASWAVPASASSLPSVDKAAFKLPCRDFTENFDSKDVLTTVENWTGNSAADRSKWISEYSPHDASIESGSLVLRITKTHTNSYGRIEGLQAAVSFPRLFSTGRVCASMKSSAGPGIVTALVAIAYNASSVVDDEIDLEWVGGDRGNYLQTNWFNEGREDYTHGRTGIPISPDSSEYFHTYCIERTENSIVWSLDGNPVRTDYSADHPFGLPFRPARIVFNLWDGGQGAKGTMEWSGGPSDWSEGAEEKRVEIDWVSVECWGEQEDDPPLPPTSRTTSRTLTTTRQTSTLTSTTSTSTQSARSSSTFSSTTPSTRSPTTTSTTTRYIPPIHPPPLPHIPIPIRSATESVIPLSVDQSTPSDDAEQGEPGRYDYLLWIFAAIGGACLVSVGVWSLLLVSRGRRCPDEDEEGDGDQVPLLEPFWLRLTKDKGKANRDSVGTGSSEVTLFDSPVSEAGDGPPPPPRTASLAPYSPLFLTRGSFSAPIGQPTLGTGQSGLGSPLRLQIPSGSAPSSPGSAWSPTTPISAALLFAGVQPRTPG